MFVKISAKEVLIELKDNDNEQAFCQFCISVEEMRRFNRRKLY